MEITNHGYERYCERVLNIPEKDIKLYLDLNRDQVKIDLLAIYNAAIHIYTGKYYDQNIAHYYISGDLLFVVNEAKQAIITLYYVDFGFAKNTNLNIIADLIKEIYTYRAQQDIEVPIHDENMLNINVKLECAQNQISSLKRQIELLEENKATLEQNKKISNTSIQMIDESIKQVASKLCYSINYKLDALKRK